MSGALLLAWLFFVASFVVVVVAWLVSLVTCSLVVWVVVVVDVVAGG